MLTFGEARFTSRCSLNGNTRCQNPGEIRLRIKGTKADIGAPSEGKRRATPCMYEVQGLEFLESSGRRLNSAMGRCGQRWSINNKDPSLKIRRPHLGPSRLFMAAYYDRAQGVLLCEVSVLAQVRGIESIERSLEAETQALRITAKIVSLRRQPWGLRL